MWRVALSILVMSLLLRFFDEILMLSLFGFWMVVVQVVPVIGVVPFWKCNCLEVTKGNWGAQ